MSNTENTENSYSKKGMLIGIIVVLLLINVGFLYFWNIDRNLKTEAQTLLDQKESELAKTMTELNQYKGKNAQLDSMIQAANEALNAKSESLDSLMKSNRLTKNLLNQFKQENSKLKLLASRYAGQIDSLIKTNELLVEENSTLKVTINEEKDKTAKLINENQKLNTKITEASALKTDQLVITAFKTKSNGTESETTKAKNTDKIKMCIRLLENKISAKGNRDVYFRIISPDGTTLYAEDTGSGKFIVNGKETLYSAKQTVSYTNQDLTACSAHSKGTDYKKGTYKVEVYLENTLVNTGTIELK